MQATYAPVPMSLKSGPRQRRRSSISEHIQRILHIERPDRQSCSFCSDDDQSTNLRFASVHHQEAGNSHHQNPESTINSIIFPKSQSVPNGTEHSPLPPSVQIAQLPASMADSSPTVVPLSSDETASHSQSMRQSVRVDIEEMRNTICVSPTWAKHTSGKERRATRRLEVERRELERRLQQLEEAQSRVEHGVYKRNSRRLTKKQPLSHSSRSSSVSAERPRSLSGPFSSLFSGSRRSSWSRSSSVNRHDFAFLRRRSADAPNRRPMETSFNITSEPPILPLILPERFGTAITRELASRNAALLPCPIQPSPMQRSLHTTTKSDDLHESWRTAQAWQRKDRQEMDGETLVQKRGSDTTCQDNGENQNLNDEVSPTVKRSKPSTDLDREVFTAALKHERKGDLLANSPAGLATQTDNLATQDGVASQRQTIQPDNYQPIPSGNPLASKVTTARQIQEIRSSVMGQASPGKRNLPAALTIKAPMGNLSKSHVEASVYNHPKTYKSSPLASNPTTTDDIDMKKETKAARTPHPVYTTVTQSSRFSGHYSDEENRGRSRTPVSSMKNDEMAQSRSGPRDVSDNQSLSNESQQLPIKSNKRYPNGRHGRSFSINATSQRTAGITVRSPNLAASTQPKRPVANATVTQNTPLWTKCETNRVKPFLADASPSVREAESRASHSAHAIETPGNGTFQDLLDRREKVCSRASSRDSSHAAYSSYDTADEDAPGRPDPRPHSQSIRDPESSHPLAVRDTLTEEETHDPPAAGRPSRMNTLRKKPLQKAKVLQKDQLVAKVFVICCHCRYWHDMPSEVYAKLACPERLPGGLRSKNSTRRSSVPSPEAMDNCKMPFPRRFQPFNANSHTQSSRGMADTRPSPVHHPSSLQCCWCGHGMNKSCCQGWTTIVQMRERHH